MNAFDEDIFTTDFTPLSESEAKDLRSELARIELLPFSVGQILSQLKQSGYRIAFSSKFPQYLRASAVRSGGGAITSVGADGFMFQLPGKPKILVPYGIILLQLP